MLEKLLAIILIYHATRVPPLYRHEPEATRESRLQTVVQAITDECTENPIPGWPYRACVALGYTIPQWESGFIKEVHEGSKRGPAGEVCLFQLHRRVIGIPNPKYAITARELLDTMGVDYEHTRNCVRVGMRIARYHISRCRLKYEGGGWAPAMYLFAEYHNPSTTCQAVVLNMSGMRARSYAALLQRLPEKP
jgi:hypothetical protein